MEIPSPRRLCKESAPLHLCNRARYALLVAAEEVEKSRAAKLGCATPCAPLHGGPCPCDAPYLGPQRPTAPRAALVPVPHVLESVYPLVLRLLDIAPIIQKAGWQGRVNCLLERRNHYIPVCRPLARMYPNDHSLAEDDVDRRRVNYTYRRRTINNEARTTIHLCIVVRPILGEKASTVVEESIAVGNGWPPGNPPRSRGANLVHHGYQANCRENSDNAVSEYLSQLFHTSANDPSSATRPVGRHDCNNSGMARLAQRLVRRNRSFS